MVSYLRGKFLIIRDDLRKASTRTKTTYKSNITKVRRRIIRRLNNALLVKKVRRSRVLRKNTYFYRYIRRKRARIAKKTLYLLKRLSPSYQDEEANFEAVLKKIRARKLRKGFSITSRDFRPFCFGTVYITHRRRNTFITIFKHAENGKQVVFKNTAGLNGYLGPKRPTKHGRESVAKMASAFLRTNTFTSVDIVFTKSIGRFFTYLIRGLLTYRVYVRHMYITKRRSHGYTRLKKKRRT